MVNYTKVAVTDVKVVELAKKSGLPASQVAAFINNQSYRKAYHTQRANQMKALKALLPKEVK